MKGPVSKWGKENDGDEKEDDLSYTYRENLSFFLVKLKRFNVNSRVLHSISSQQDSLGHTKGGGTEELGVGHAEEL